MSQIRTILSLLANAPSTLATIYDFELEKKVVLECVKIAFFEFSVFSLVKT